MNRTSDELETVFELRTPVHTTVKGHAGKYSPQAGYLVIAKQKPRGQRSQWDRKPGSLMFRTNGGTWAIETLLGLDSYAQRPGQRCEKLSIDFGQDWVIQNMSAVLDEIVGHEYMVNVENMLTTLRSFLVLCCSQRRETLTDDHIVELRESAIVVGNNTLAITCNVALGMVRCSRQRKLVARARCAELLGFDVTAPTTPLAAVVVDSNDYEMEYGHKPRGRGAWGFVFGKRDRDAEMNDVWFAGASETNKMGRASLTYGEAKRLAVAEAKRRGVSLVGVCT